MRANARRAILDAAMDLFATRGIAATTLEVAERAGVSKGLVFNYFPSKLGLLAALIEEHVAAGAALLDAVEEQFSPEARLGEAIDRLAALAFERSGSNTLFVSIIAQPEVGAELRNHASGVHAALRNFYSRLGAMFAAAGSANPATDTFLLLSTLNGIGITSRVLPTLTEKSASAHRDLLRQQIRAMFVPRPR